MATKIRQNPAPQIPKGLELTIIMRLSRETEAVDSYVLPHLFSKEEYLKNMVQKGWVEKVSSADPHAKLYRLTTKGNRIADAVSALEKACK